MAREPSIDARSRLLSTLTDMVFGQRQPTADEVAMLCEVAGKVLPKADEFARAHFAEAVAQSASVTPIALQTVLDDTAAIAAPVLRHSPLLRDSDLIRIVETRSDDYLLPIAMRSALSTPLVELLIARGGPKVLFALVENQGVHLSAAAVHTLVEIAETDEAVCRSLIRRSEVPSQDAERLVHLIARNLRVRMGGSRPGVPELAAKPDKPATVEAKARSVRDLVASISAKLMSADVAVLELAKENRFNDLTTLISMLAGLDDVSVLRLLVRADVNGISVVLKALGISDRGFDAVVSLRRHRLKHSEIQSRFEREDFAKLNQDECRAKLASWVTNHIRP